MPEPEQLLEMTQAHFAGGETEAHKSGMTFSEIYNSPITGPGQK